MTIVRKFGIGMVIMGGLMFFLAASVFTYRGNINPIVSNTGMYSFVLWLPTIIMGLILVLIGKRKQKSPTL